MSLDLQHYPTPKKDLLPRHPPRLRPTLPRGAQRLGSKTGGDNPVASSQLLLQIYKIVGVFYVMAERHVIVSSTGIF